MLRSRHDQTRNERNQFLLRNEAASWFQIAAQTCLNIISVVSGIVEANTKGTNMMGGWWYSAFYGEILVRRAALCMILTGVV
jgi:hypothetical protein